MNEFNDVSEAVALFEAVMASDLIEVNEVSEFSEVRMV